MKKWLAFPLVLLLGCASDVRCPHPPTASSPAGGVPSPETPTRPEKQDTQSPSPPSSPTPPKGLEAFEGATEFTEEKTQELMKAYKTATGFDLGLEFTANNLRPLWVKRFNAAPVAWMLLLVYHGTAFGNELDYVQAHCFDWRWRRLSKQGFPTGLTLLFKRADVEKSRELGEDVLVLRLLRGVRGTLVRPPAEGIEHQIYAHSGGRLELVRVQNDQGELVRNDYREWVPDRGLRLKNWNHDVWLSSLKGKSDVARLATLVWLTGQHLSTASPRLGNYEEETVEESRDFETARDSSAIQQALKELKESPHPWVKSYVDLGILKDNR